MVGLKIPIIALCWIVWRAIKSEPVAPEALGEQVSERLRHDRQKVVFFKIDDDANYGRAVKVMDICKCAGAATLGIITKDDAK